MIGTGYLALGWIIAGILTIILVIKAIIDY